ncbi:MAG: hypothetical protein Ct9H300mP24_7980 [Candidatus Neomarinimicrobiota bacterium]|nr:MAG: hypothetical protein Ct9H300mP24_7980 [Candidatus Neomarinimicrobiota bacterium]
MNDEFLIENDVVGYYKIKPTVIKYVDFYAEKQFEWMEGFPIINQVYYLKLLDL